jgi:HTH-type transcriptional regulator, sugar sensing transcriptional regulator
MKNIRLLDRNKPRDTGAAEPTLLNSLHRLGFTDHEARTYLALSSASPATAYEVANATGLPRANVYNVLRSLQAKGAIQPVSEEPLRYVPVDPKEFFAGIEKSTASLCRDVMQKMERQVPSQNDAYVWVANGHRQVVARISDLIAAAKAEIWIKSAAHLLEPFTEGIRAVADRGVEVKIILYGPPPPSLAKHPRIKLFTHEGQGTAQGISDVLYTMTVDLDGVVIASFTSETTASYARNHAIIYVTQVYLLHEMYLADIYAVMGDELDWRFGKGLAELRQKYRPHNMERYVIDEPVHVATSDDTPAKKSRSAKKRS